MSRSINAALWLPLVSAGFVAAQTGSVTYTLQKAQSPTADQADAYARIQKAMDSAIGYYNNHTRLRKILTVQYNPDVATADGSSNGNIRFGSSRSYMQVGTAMHEIAHTLGIGTTEEYKALIVNGVYTGKAATAALQEIDGAGSQLKGDGQHFWPYGINYESEVKGVGTLVAHCKIVQAIYQDLFHENIVFEGRIRSRSTLRCMARIGTELALSDCDDSTSLARVVSMGEDALEYRIEFGDRVLDAPNKSTSSGLVIGLYGWNGGTNQRLLASRLPLPREEAVKFRMAHSNLALEAKGSSIVQNREQSGLAAQDWELVGSAAASTQPSVRRSLHERRSRFEVDLLGRRLAPTSAWILNAAWK